MFTHWKSVYCSSFIYPKYSFDKCSREIQSIKMLLQDSDKFVLTHTKFFNSRSAIHTDKFKSLSSLSIDKSLITGYF